MPSTRSIVLVPSYAQTVIYRKQQALMGSTATMRCEVLTLAAWVRDLWELFGDGRAIVTDTLRDALLSAVFCNHYTPQDTVQIHEQAVYEHDRFAPTSTNLSGCTGMVSLAARLVREASGLDEFERTLTLLSSHDAAVVHDDASDVFAEGERTILEALVQYRSYVAQLGYVELGEAMALLPHIISSFTSPAPLIAHHVSLQAFPSPSLTELRFLNELAHIGAIGELVIDTPITTIACALKHCTAKLRFAFPSGRYAEPMLLADLAEHACATCGDEFQHENLRVARVVIAAKDPMSVYDSIALGCAARGLSCAVRASRSCAQTAFGAAYAAMRRCVTASEEIHGDLSDLTDVLLSPFSGFSVASAQRIDTKLRQDRRITRQAHIAELRAISEPFAWLEELACDPEAFVLVGAIGDTIRRLSGVTEAFKREQLAVLNILHEIMEAVCRACGLVGIDTTDDAMHLIDQQFAHAFVDASRANTPLNDDEIPDVLILELQAAAALGVASCDVAIATDMTASAYPVATHTDAIKTLLAKMGFVDLVAPVASSSFCAADGQNFVTASLVSSDDALTMQQAELCALLGLPTQYCIIERCLFDTEANPTYPAAVVQELVDCFRADSSALDDIDNLYSLPASLQENMVTRGEEALFENAAVVSGAQHITAHVSTSLLSEVSKAARARIVLPREIEGGVLVRTPCLSPSQIESYLECPCKWFVSRRLRLDELDSSFGPIEMGNFSHRVLNLFYQVFQEETGKQKVTRALLGDARTIMKRICNESFNSLVLRTELERREFDECKIKLMRFLDYEVEFLPNFSPKYFELDIATSAHVPYAGYEVMGRVDRIDVDAKGRAVIIDYKSSVSNDYRLYSGDRDYPHKVQALVYARAIERLLDVRVVGALYVSYGRTSGAAGAYDPDVISESVLPHVRHDNCRPRAHRGESFKDVLDATEERVASALKRMLAGDIAPQPLSAASCTWCPVYACPERKA